MTVRLLGEAVAGSRIASVEAYGVNTLKSVDPPLASFTGAEVTGLGRRGKQIVVETDRGIGLLIHLMSAGRLQLEQAPPPTATAAARPAAAGAPRAATAVMRPGQSRVRRGPGGRDRSLRLVVALDDGRELRLREFGTKQAAWVRPIRLEELDDEETIAGLGPEAWPDPPDFASLLDQPRPLHSVLRDQHVIAGIGRSWADEILWSASLSPFKRGSDLTTEEAGRLREATVARLGGAIEHYESAVTLPIPTRLPMPLEVHGRKGEPCPRCGAELAGVHFEDYTIAYCPACQTGGQVLKDRRRSRILK